jgi:hypothetical protein
VTTFATDASPAAAPRDRFRALRPWLAVALLILVIVSVSAIYNDSGEAGALDPDAATPEGSRAVAALLRDRDVTVEEFDQVSPAMTAAEQGNATLLVPFPALLSTETIQRLADLPTSVRVVLVRPDSFTLDDLDLDIELDEVGITAEARRPGCDLPEAVAAGSAEVALERYNVKHPGATTCYDRSLVRVDDGGAEIVVLGAADPLTNDRLDDEGNAALSLGLLSAHDRVLWLIPDGPEPQGNRPVSVSEILPPWVGASILLLTVASILAMLWRGRRLGPPVSEPLPVVVRSAETVEGRARLYRRARASAEAYEALRAGAFARLLPAIGLGTDPDYRAVVEAVADRSGRPAAEVYAVLYGPPPADDASLVTSADLLDSVVENTLDPSHVETALHRLDGEGRPQ